jgi:DNA-directed RNA polymerase specialized sigma24 family protein
MTPDDTHLIRLLEAGDADAAQPLWERYFGRLVALARGRLRGARRREADEEDVALSAFDSFCRGVMAGRFPRLNDSTDLWRVLVVITARKAADQVAREHRRKRCPRVDGSDQPVRGESAFLVPGAGGEEMSGLDGVAGAEPSPEFAALVAEEQQRLFDGLRDDTLRSVAGWKLEGWTNEEIAGKLGCSLSRVERKLRLIRKMWEEARDS